MTGRQVVHIRFGETVRALRALSGYSQEGFADSIRIHRTSVGTSERGEGNPTLNTIVRVVQGLNITLGEFFSAMERDRSG